MTEAAADLCNDLLDNARNYGGRLSDENRKRLLALVADPSPATWDAAHGIVLGGSLDSTLWCAMREVDLTCPRRDAPAGKTSTPASRWNGYTPDPMLVLAAIRYVLTGENPHAS